MNNNDSSFNISLNSLLKQYHQTRYRNVIGNPSISQLVPKNQIEKKPLSIQEMKELRQKKKQKLTELYDYYYGQCRKHMTRYYENEEKTCIFTVPLMLYGNKNYSYIECINYIKENLRREGVKSRDIDNYLLIDLTF